MESMNYSENHLRNWLLNHKCINISCLEKTCGIKQRNLTFFIKDQRRISVDEFKNVERELANYGYIPLNDE